MATKYATISSFEKAQTIEVNGQVMTIAEYKKMLAEKKKANGKKKATRRNKKNPTEITILPKDIKIMLRGAKVMTSLSAYYKHGYRQWGTICKTILNLKEIQSPFVRYTMSAKAVNEVINEINDIAKHNSKSVFAYVRKLSWKLEDVAKDMKALHDGVNKSGVLNSPMQTHECINGTGRRLGLNILMQRTDEAIKELEIIVNNLQYIADNYTTTFEKAAIII